MTRSAIAALFVAASLLVLGVAVQVFADPFSLPSDAASLVAFAMAVPYCVIGITLFAVRLLGVDS